MVMNRKLRVILGLLLISPLPIIAARRIAQDVGWAGLGEMALLGALIVIGMALILSALVSYNEW